MLSCRVGVSERPTQKKRRLSQNERKKPYEGSAIQVINNLKGD
jgi:hypothetical protein